MQNSDAIIASLIERIGHVYKRPMMYGGNANEVDLILTIYHDLWADIL